MSRPAIPRQLKRDVLIEAGHRCALPSCHQTPVEIAHIIPWETVKEHTFDNLIALCPTCHTRYDNHDIDRQSMLQYKANLSVLNSRYSDLEKRVLLIFARSPQQDEIWLDKWSDIHLMYLLEDGLLEKDPKHRAAMSRDVVPYCITQKGRQFIQKWLRAKELE
jgi:HNH endonuclease